jgi:RimJ/RimL family protein N-acetyltransferase
MGGSWLDGSVKVRSADTVFNARAEWGKGGTPMNDVLELHTARGPVTLRPERPGDADFLYGLFRSHTLPDLAPLAADDAGREMLVRMQFLAQTSSYRTQYAHARFDIVEMAGAAVGRLVVDDNEQEACIVDFALLPETRGSGIGTAILASVLARLRTQRRPVRCMVLFNNEASLRMCLRVGFVQTGSVLPFLQLQWQPGTA